MAFPLQWADARSARAPAHAPHVDGGRAGQLVRLVRDGDEADLRAEEGDGQADPEQVEHAEKTSADYIAIGPVFSTPSKVNPDPVVGLEGVRKARSLTRKPLVAIGGINRANCGSVIEAGADSVAVISDLVRDPRKSAEEFLRILG